MDTCDVKEELNNLEEFLTQEAEIKKTIQDLQQQLQTKEKDLKDLNESIEICKKRMDFSRDPIASKDQILRDIKHVDVEETNEIDSKTQNINAWCLGAGEIFILDNGKKQIDYYAALNDSRIRVDTREKTCNIRYYAKEPFKQAAMDGLILFGEIVRFEPATGCVEVQLEDTQDIIAQTAYSNISPYLSLNLQQI